MHDATELVVLATLQGLHADPAHAAVPANASGILEQLRKARALGTSAPEAKTIISSLRAQISEFSPVLIEKILNAVRAWPAKELSSAIEKQELLGLLQNSRLALFPLCARAVFDRVQEIRLAGLASARGEALFQHLGKQLESLSSEVALWMHADAANWNARSASERLLHQEILEFLNPDTRGAARIRAVEELQLRAEWELLAQLK